MKTQAIYQITCPNCEVELEEKQIHTFSCPGCKKKYALTLGILSLLER